MAVVGEEGAGKSYLVHRLTHDTSTTPTPTKGLQVLSYCCSHCYLVSCCLVIYGNWCLYNIERFFVLSVLGLRSYSEPLQIVEWKYRGGDLLFPFRNRWFTFDLWDFSGNPEYRCIYSCFNCFSSIHLVVASATRPHDELVKWLSDIQAMSRHRVPVVIVFTHMDCLRTKEARDEFKRQRQRWIDHHNKKVSVPSVK